MGRHKQEFARTTEVVLRDEDTPGLPAMKEALDQVAIVDLMVQEKFDAIEALGIIKGATFLETVSQKLIAETVIKLRESKKYKGLQYTDENGNAKQVSHFQEFCTVYLGKSARRVEQIMSNYKDLGPDLYEQAEKIGFRQRDYNALKALPGEDRKLIEQAIEAQSLDHALDLMQQLAAKNQREKEALEKTIGEQQKDLVAKDDVIRQKSEANNRWAERFVKIENEAKAQSIDEKQVAARQRFNDAMFRADAEIQAGVRAAMMRWMEVDKGARDTISAQLICLGRRITVLRHEFLLPDVIDEDIRPDWMRMPKTEAGEAGEAQDD